MKKIISVVLIFVVLAAGTVSVSAVDSEPVAADVISLKFIGITLLTASLSIDSWGCATCSGKVIPSSSTYTSYLTVCLQKYVSGNWTTIRTWSSSNAGLSGVNISGYYYVPSGIYRACSIARIYSSSGTFVDSATVYSAMKKY